MGMFDSFFLVGGEWQRQAACPDGHAMTGELQSKDLECVLAVVWVHDGGRCQVDASMVVPQEVDYARLHGPVSAYRECGKGGCGKWVDLVLRFEDGRLASIEDIVWSASFEDALRGVPCA